MRRYDSEEINNEWYNDCERLRRERDNLANRCVELENIIKERDNSLQIRYKMIELLSNQNDNLFNIILDMKGNMER